MSHLEGSHGTSSYRAEQIREEGFKLSTGRGGRGAYFWRRSEYCRDLAIAWFKQRVSEGTFSREPDVRCAVIYVQMEIPEDQVLDLEDPDVKDEIASLSTLRRINPNNDKDIAALYDLYVSEIEKELGKPIFVTIIRVAVPKNYLGYPMKMVGAPLCFIARDPSVPQILRTEIVN